jgi:hypothetical protein
VTYQTHMTAKLGMRGTFVCRNAAGEVVKTIQFSGAVPLSRLGVNEEEARSLVEQQGKSDGNHSCE